MAIKNMNIVSMTFVGQAMRQPVDFRADFNSETVEDSAGIDPTISSNDAVRRRAECQCAFKDFDDAVLLRANLLYGEGTLIIVTRPLGVSGAGSDKTININNARLRQVIINGTHNVVATHFANFVIRSTDGISNPGTT